MTSTLTPPRATHHGRPPAARRFGYTVAIALNVAMLWVTHQLLGWGWPGFLTDDFDRLLPLVTASFVASIAVNVCFLVRDRGRFRAFADLVTAAFGLAVSLRTWDVFPFGFAGYDQDWTWLFRTVLVVAIAGTVIAVIVGLVKLVRPSTADRG